LRRFAGSFAILRSVHRRCYLDYVCASRIEITEKHCTTSHNYQQMAVMSTITRKDDGLCLRETYVETISCTAGFRGGLAQ